MKPERIVLVSPPFSSHLHPMMALAHVFNECGMEAIIACSEPFREQITSSGVGFLPLLVNRNANTGIAQRTDQPDEEKERLDEFFQSTYRGSVETLFVQSRHRKKDMLPDPEGLRRDIQRIQEKMRPDLWVVNQLSYGVTLAMYCLRLRFLTFCLPHPSTIPEGDTLFGVPVRWPSVFNPDPDALVRLSQAAAQVEREFTDEFNRIIASCDKTRKRIENAFRLTSNEAILFNYPDFRNDTRNGLTPRRIFMGSCFQRQSISEKWKMKMAAAKSRRPRVLIAFGTFLSFRTDVIARCIEAVKQSFPESFTVVAAGAGMEQLLKYAGKNIVIEDYIPQKGLLPFMDVVIHHGGNNTFTEALSCGKPMLIFPFSSDQFDIACDAEEQGVGKVLNPNSFSVEDVRSALLSLIDEDGARAEMWGKRISRLGPQYAVQMFIGQIDERTS
jgi:UDP:flavonoid glycosyltransferase YjiC (YdhE family)